MEEWYEDRTLYHYIGFLIEYGADINELMKKSKEMNKTNFLTDYIKGNKLKGLMKGIKLSDLNYGDKEVKQVLLLFNILTVLQSNKSDMRFPFSKYKKEKWDIEHISSQTDKRINDDSQRLEWIHDMFEFLVGSTEEEDISAYVDNLKKEIQKIESKEKDKNIAKSKVDSKKEELILINRIAVLHSNSQREKINDTEFDECFDAVQKYYGEDKLEDKDNIRNLTLLDAQTNRGYGNAFFPIKRKWIISNDSQGIFVPIATKNVFLKYYTRKGSNLMVWDKTDAEDYVTAMEQTLREYLK